MPMKTPAFQFYPDDFIGGTSAMTPAEVGAYILLLCHQWTSGGLPNDERRLFALARTNNEPITEAAVRYVVAEKFVVGEDGKLRNPRMERVRTVNEAWRKKSALGGKSSGSKRSGDSEWGKSMGQQRTNNEPLNEPTTNSPSPSPSPSTSLTESAPPPPLDGTLKPKKEKKPKIELTDLEWMTDLKSKPENQGINIDAEYSRACEWCRKNGRSPSRRFFGNWLKKAAEDKPLAIVAKKPFQSVTHSAPKGGWKSCL